MQQGEVVRVTKKRNPIEATYQIHGHDLTITKTRKYLGVVISEDLSWKAHVDASTKKANNSASTKKANNSLAFLRRNLSSCPPDVKAQCYRTLVRPILDYASSAWGPHTTLCIQQLEAVQCRASRFVTGHYRLPDDTGPGLAIPPTATPRCQTCVDVPHHLWVSGHPSLQILTSC